MSGKTARQEARERLDQVYQELRDKYFPSDETQPVKDGTFWQWEELADEFDRKMTAAVLEELARLSEHAALKEPGPCPYCQSANTKWLQEEGRDRRQSKHGKVLLPRQVARCRPCGRSFSPSGAALGSGFPTGPDAPGRRAGLSGSGPSAL